MKKYLVKRPNDTVEVLILPNKDGSGYQYVNLTKGHICPCRFKTESEALRDMDKKISEGKVLYYEEIKEIKEILEKTIDFDDAIHRIIRLEEELEGFRLKLEALEGQTPWKDIKDKSELIGKLSKAKELIKTLLLIADNKVSQMEFLLCVAEAERFLRNN